MTEALDLCPQEDLDAASQALSDGGGSEAIAPLMEQYPGDPRLRFLMASILASEKAFDQARIQFEAALDRAPDFAVARFQLGLLHYTSDAFEQAIVVWAPLAQLPETDPLRLFAEGLVLFGKGHVQEGTTQIERGLAANSTNPPLNANIAMILAELTGTAEETEQEATSETAMLLQQFSQRTRH